MNSKALSVLAEAGIVGAEAEIALRRMLSALAAPTEQARSMLDQLGLEADFVDPAHERTVDVVERLHEAGLDLAQATAAFGQQGGAVYDALSQRLERFKQLEG